MSAREIRSVAEVELRREGGVVTEITGYAAVFDSLSRPIEGRFVERIKPGAFARALREKQDVRALVNHEPALILGRTKAGTLALAEDGRGLRVTIKVGTTQAARDTVESIERGDLDSMSFAFRARGERWFPGAGPNGLDLRELHDVDLFDVSPVTFAAYDDTSVAVRSWEAECKGLGAAQQQGEEQRGALILRQLEHADAGFASEGSDLSEGERRSCFASHLGLYAMEQRALEAVVDAIARGAVAPRAPVALEDGDDFDAKPEAPLFEMLEGGVALLRMEGPITKRGGKFSPCSALRLRQGLRAAMAAPEVLGVMLLVDSPGGSVSGIDELAEEVRLSEKQKPVHAYVEDCCASAALWVASQAGRVAANRMAEVGSIGVLCVLYDESERYRKAGVKVHVVSTGPQKGRGIEGTSVTKSDLSEVAARIAPINAAFKAAVGSGRAMLPEEVEPLATGKMFPSFEAARNGLIDGVETFEEALAALRGAAGDGPASDREKEPSTLPAGVPANATDGLRRRLDLLR